MSTDLPDGASAFPKQITDPCGVRYARTGRTKLSEASGRVIAEYRAQTGATLWASVHGLVTSR